MISITTWEKIIVSTENSEVPVVGFLVGLTQRKGELDYEKYLKLCDDADIPKDERCKQISRPDAFRLALKELESSTSEVSDVTGKVLSISYKVKQLSAYVYAVVKEIVGKVNTDEDTWVAERSESYRAVIDKESETIQVTGLDDISINGELTNRIEVRTTELTTKVTSEKLKENAVTLIKKNWSGIPYTATHGGLFFVPAHFKLDLERHQAVINRFGELTHHGRRSTQLRMIPCLDSDEQRRYIANDVEIEIESSLEKLVKDVMLDLDRTLKKQELEYSDVVKVLSKREAVKKQFSQTVDNYTKLLNVPIQPQFKASRQDAQAIGDRFENIAKMLKDTNVAKEQYQQALKLVGLDDLPMTDTSILKRFDNIKETIATSEPKA